MSKCYLDLGSNSLGAYDTLKGILGIDDSFEKIFVEANEECYEYIYHRMGGIPNSRLIEAAIAPETKEYTLITRDDMRGDSAATLMGLDFINLSIGESNQKYPSYLTYKVQGIKISDILSQIKSDEIYIKIDIEGSEFYLLENFPMEYLPRIKRMFCEFHCHTEEVRNRRDAILDKYSALGFLIENWD